MPPLDAIVVDNLAELVELETLDRDLFRGHHTSDSLVRSSLYGGQVAAQALRAAGTTVDADRFPHSLHGYFLRRGMPDLPVLFQVNRDRDGGAFSARHVNAIQNGEVIFSMLISFHVDEPSASYEDVPIVEAPSPDELERRGSDEVLDVREVTQSDRAANIYSNRMWVRSARALPDDRLVQACALTYVSDLGSGFGQLQGALPPGGPSIDHVVWFHEPIRVDDWVLVSLWPAKAGSSRGVYLGSLRSHDGRLGAMIGQEMLLRPKPTWR